MTQTTSETDELPRTVPLADVLDLFDELEPGDRVLWGDRSIPCTVARVVDPEDREGQALTASVIDPGIKRRQAERAEVEDRDPEDFFLEPHDVFIDPTGWGGLRGLNFVLIQGPRGGFYAIARAERKGRTTPALFRAVRSFHSTRMGQPGQGAWGFEGWLTEGEFTLTERGEPPEELDPVGDLPAYEDIRENRVVAYDRDEGEHYVVADTLEEVFDRGLYTAHEEAQAEFSAGVDGEDEEEAWDADVPEPERVTGRARQSPDNPDGDCHGRVTVTEVFRSEYGAKASLEGPAPWETPDHAEPMNEVLKSTPWNQTHRRWDPDREAWTIDADELTKVASVLRDHGYDVTDDRE